MLHVALVRRFLRGVVAAGCCATLLACSGGSGPSTTTSGSADAIARYGQAAPRDPAGFTYQPDVVVVDGGPEAVRSVSADGLVWTVDGKASGLDGLDVGEVMFLTSRAAGRVAAKEPAGDDVAITLAPVQLNEIIRDGHIKVDTTIDSEAALLQEIPDLPGALGVPDETDVGDIDPSLRGGGGGNNSPGFAGVSLVRLAEPGKGGPRLPPPAKSKMELTVGKWGLSTSLDKKGLELSASYKPVDNLKFGVDVMLGFKSLRVVADIVLVAGKLTGSMTSILYGVDFLDLKVYAGVANGADDNQKVRLEIPAEVLNRPIIVGGLPMVLNLKVKMFVQTALSGKNSTLTASGRWGLNGPLGISGGTQLLPKFSVVNSIIDSIGGIAIGPSGIVLGSEFKFMVGIGVPGAATGPYGKMRFAVGVVNGSAFGAPLARCTRADLIIKGGGGVGLSLSEKATEGIRKAIPGLPKFKADLEAELLGTIKEASQTRPNVALCVAPTG